ncbi:MAG: hypothetical protein ABSG57_11225 [Candidatus Bathyarchaeia archaeon]
MSEDEVQHLKSKVEELEKKIESIIWASNTTTQIFMSLFDNTRKDMKDVLSLLEKLPENITENITENAIKLAIEKLKKNLRENEEKLQKAQKNAYIS